VLRGKIIEKGVRKSLVYQWKYEGIKEETGKEQ
jgi:hypothetical protein